MKAMTKIVLVTTSLIGMGALTACQSTTSHHDQRGERMMHGGNHHKHDRQMSPEQRAEMEKMRAQHKEMRAQVQKACEGKTVGQSVQVKAGEQTLDGRCNMVFKADRKAMQEMKHEFKERGGMMRHHGPRMKDMTEEQRAQIQQQFEQKRQERQAQWDTLQKSCEGQSNGKTVQVKLGEKTVDGTCVIKFQPQQQVKSTVVTPVATATTAKAS